jgi:hypothetical protein
MSAAVHTIHFTPKATASAAVPPAVEPGSSLTRLSAAAVASERGDARGVPRKEYRGEGLPLTDALGRSIQAPISNAGEGAQPRPSARQRGVVERRPPAPNPSRRKGRRATAPASLGCRHGSRRHERWPPADAAAEIACQEDTGQGGHLGRVRSCCISRTCGSWPRRSPMWTKQSSDLERLDVRGLPWPSYRQETRQSALAAPQPLPRTVTSRSDWFNRPPLRAKGPNECPSEAAPSRRETRRAPRRWGTRGRDRAAGEARFQNAR